MFHVLLIILDQFLLENGGHLQKYTSTGQGCASSWAASRRSSAGSPSSTSASPSSSRRASCWPSPWRGPRVTLLYLYKYYHVRFLCSVCTDIRHLCSLLLVHSDCEHATEEETFHTSRNIKKLGFLAFLFSQPAGLG